jgi:hypothetical protein
MYSRSVKNGGFEYTRELDESSLTFGAVTGLLLVIPLKEKNQFLDYKTHPQQESRYAHCIHQRG